MSKWTVSAWLSGAGAAFNAVAAIGNGEPGWWSAALWALIAALYSLSARDQERGSA